MAAGEAVCLVGRNGAGKTTTIETIMGRPPARAGAIHFGGPDITRLPTHKRARAGIGYAPEDAGVFPELTVAENFQIGKLLAEASAREARRAPPSRRASSSCSPKCASSWAAGGST